MENKISFFNKNLLEIFDEHASYITTRVTKPFLPWIMDDIKFLMDQRDNTVKKLKMFMIGITIKKNEKYSLLCNKIRKKIIS